MDHNSPPDSSDTPSQKLFRRMRQWVRRQTDNASGTPAADNAANTGSSQPDDNANRSAEQPPDAVSSTNHAHQIEREVPAMSMPQPPALPTALELAIFAPLDTVGTENYIRYGNNGPQHALSSSGERPAPPATIEIKLELSKADGTIIHQLDALTLHRSAHQPQQRTEWTAHHAGFHTRLVWVWDFFRMLSYCRLRIEAPANQDQTTSEETTLFQAVQGLTTDDRLTIQVETAAGPITQHHTLQSSPRSV
jgi:hypothetical protein